MEVIRYPKVEDCPGLLQRPTMNVQALHQTVGEILADVKQRGDEAVLEYERRFDKVTLTSLEVDREEWDAAKNMVPAQLRKALELAHENIYRFHKAQAAASVHVETQPGIECWQKAIPIERVGLYIPGGTAPLFSTVLMLATPATVAGCKDIVLCTPPTEDGTIHPAILVAAQIAGVSKVYKAGGAQAIGAMAYGTKSIPKVYKIFGPGNQYVTAAKQLVSINDVAIDMPAGPSEVCIVADDTCNPQFVAADLLSQAEHGKDSQVVLITDSELALRQILEQVERQLQPLPRKQIASLSLENSKAVLVNTMSEAMDISNVYAPEHLIIASDHWRELAEKVANAGSVFLGHYACESAGDYASGTNHTLPTNGHAKAYSGVSLGSFMKMITFQRLSPEGIEAIGEAVELMAENEQLHAHKNAMSVRRNHIKKGI